MLTDPSAGCAQLAALVGGEDRDQPRFGSRLGHAEQRDQPPAVGGRIEDRAPESREGLEWHARPRHAAPVAEPEGVEPHGAAPPIAAAAAPSAARTEAGRNVPSIAAMTRS